MPVDVNAELKRRRKSDGALLPWEVNDDGSEPVADAEARATLREIRDRLASHLTHRLMPPKPEPTDGYTVWMDTEDATHIYVLEAPAAANAGDTGFRGIRLPKSAGGGVVGKCEVNTSSTLTFVNRVSDPGWS